MPTTPLERWATWSLVAATLLAATAGGIITYFGPEIWYANDEVRLTATAFILATVAVFALTSVRVAVWTQRDRSQFDERDRAILVAAPAGQAAAMLVVLAAWTILLTEHFRSAGGQVPTFYLYLVFWSVLLVSMLTWLAGIVVGYRQR